MRYALIMLLLCYCLTISATTYFIAATGSNSNSGSSSSPWKTLAYAGSRVTASGDIIHVNAGTYTETSQCVHAPGVSIEGDGNSTVINCTNGSDYALVLSSNTEGTNGNQHIYNIKMSGGSGLNSYIGYSAILVDRRSNVEIANCTFQYFNHHGVRFEGSITDYQPTVYSTGNSFHHNTVLDCCNFVGLGDPQGSGQGCLEIGGQQGILVHDNSITVLYRTGGLNGYNIKYCQNGYNKGLKVYNNNFVRPPFSGISNDFDFSMELWNCRGGIEIYGNTMNGSIDMSGDNPAPCNDEGGYGFAAKIHHNTIGWDTWQDHEQMGVDIERAQTGGMYIYNNHFKKLSCPIKTYQGYDARAHDIVEDIYIYGNLAEGIGYNTIQWGTAFFATGHIPSDSNGIIYRRIYILNNTIIAGSGSYGTEAGINFSIYGSADNIVVKNNIIVGFGIAGDAGAIFIDGTSLTSFTNFALQDNIFYQNKRDGVMLYAGANPSYSVNSGNLTSNPLFVSSTDFHLQTGSPAIGKGVAISSVTTDYAGNSYKNPPSIGAYESGSASAPPVTPVYQSSAVENATPSLLKMTYDLSLANIVPAASAFTVLVNTVARAVNSVVFSGTNVQLTLTSPVVYGDIVTISYTKPSVNPVQSSSGGQAETISAKTVINNVNAVIPVYVSSSVENATPTLLEMTYNMSLASIVPAVSSFSVQVNSVTRAVNSVAISGTKTQLTLSGPVLYGDIVTVTYLKPSVNPLQSSTGALAVNITAQTVTNRVIAVNPVYVSSSVEKATPAILEMTYNMSLANIVPAVSSFSVLVNSTVRTLSTVTISGTKVQLTLVSKIVPGDIVNVSYTKPATNFLQSTTGGIASGISKVPVTNNCINIAPTAVLTSPAANSSFTSQSNISITASASDADGSVNLVEFYSGTTKLGSASALPYSFNWNNVPAGTYSLTVIATDNLNTKTVSPAVSISVTDRIKTPNKHPIIHIYNPRKGTSYDNLSTVTIDAVASDPDGTISKVEFYNGSEKLVELTSDPYTYTWKDVAEGTYIITAVATDNLNDTTISSPIEFVVGNSVKYDANSDNIKLYPNPNNGHFSVEFANPLQNEKSEIVITDLSGKQVYHGPVLKEELLKQIDLSDSRSGIYVMMIRDKDILVTKKFIKN
jgi:uncharacterized repeat protein (TIGR02059 family)